MNLLLDWTWESLPKIPGKNTNVHKVIHYNSFVVIVKRKYLFIGHGVKANGL